MSVDTTVRISGTQANVMSIDMYISDCPRCGVYFGITKELEGRRRADGKSLYCPNGHVMSWDSADERERRKLRREAQEARQRAESLEADRSRYQEWLRREREEHKATERSLAATKGVVTRQRNRAHAALCPVEGCKRQIVQMKRHLETKHPDYTPPTE